MNTPSIAVLAPVHHLPAEGADLPPLDSTGPIGARRLLDFFSGIVADRGLHFEVSPDGITPLGDFAPTLQFLEVRTGAESPHLDLAASFAELRLPLEEELPLDASSPPEDCARVFLTQLNSALRIAGRGFAGHPVPLVRWQALEDRPGIAVQCLGVWLADDEGLRTVSSSEDSSLALVFEDSEVEGRGLREAITALAIAGIFLGSLPTAEAGLFSRRAKTTQAEKSSKATASKLRAEVDQKILGKAAAGNTHVLIDVSKQRAYLLVNGQIAIDTPVSTARTGKYTPRGEFKITQKVRTGKTSTIYGCDLPCWMRLDDSPIGLHVGDLPGYPASAGCVRLPSNIAPLIFDHAPSGTVVKIVDHVDVESYAKAF